MWEYRTVYVERQGETFSIASVKIDPAYDQWMDEMGQHRWELVSATPRIFAGVHEGDTLYFKRPKTQATVAS
jgi:hypothetical protein